MEVEGKFTKGMLVINWLNREVMEGVTGKCRIVTRVDLGKVIQLLVEAVKDS